MATTMSLESAKNAWINTSDLRNRVLKAEAAQQPKAFREWLEFEIATLSKCPEPTENTVGLVKQYMGMWQACDVLVKAHDQAIRDRQDQMTQLLKEFEAMKQGC
jgi:hypothetical protein